MTYLAQRPRTPEEGKGGPRRVLSPPPARTWVRKREGKGGWGQTKGLKAHPGGRWASL